MPVVTSIQIPNPYTMKLKGYGFSLKNFSVYVNYATIASDSASIDSDSQITANFLNGVPIS
jgi:hypothetical protein